MNQEFNLIYEKWLLVRKPDCTVETVSLIDLFIHAHEYEDLAGELKTQDFAILRMLLAIVHTVFSRYDMDGSELTKKEHPRKRWQKIWENSRFPKEPFERYFDKWKDRFWLFDDKYPFYQVTEFAVSPTEYTSAKLIGSILKSGNKTRLFSEVAEENPKLSFSEAARWLINLNAYDDIASKPNPKRTWLCELGLIAVNGKNLFETIMYNYIPDLTASNPCWEKQSVTNIVNNEIPVPDNQAELLTVQSRRIKLIKNDEFVTGYSLTGGDYFAASSALNMENMTLWKKVDKTGEIVPMRHDKAKSAWREFGSIAAFPDVNAVNDAGKGVRVPGVIGWIALLQENDILDYSFNLSVTTATVGYNFKQSTSLPVNDNYSDTLTFHSSLLKEVNEEWRTLINRVIEKCEKAAISVYRFSCDLQIANGSDNQKVTGNSEKRRYYEIIDKPFRVWLRSISPDSVMSDKLSEIYGVLKNITLKFGEELAANTSVSGIMGKEIKISEKATKRYSVPDALISFGSIINTIYGGDKQ